jgi:hypothetical protein
VTDHLLSAALERIPELEAPSEPRESPETVEEEPETAEPRPDPLRVWEGSLCPSGIMATTIICLRQGSIRNPAYLYIGVTSGAGAGRSGVSGVGDFGGYRGGAMQDPGYELPRISIPRTPVNKGIKRVGATIPWPFLA